VTTPAMLHNKVARIINATARRWVIRRPVIGGGWTKGLRGTQP
jgi:hypothetical protein